MLASSPESQRDAIAVPLLRRDSETDEPRRHATIMPVLLSKIGIESAAEGQIVSALAAQAFLANSVFVFGRNLGPVMFMKECGVDALTGALFLSGLSILIVSPVYAKMSAGQLAARVNLYLTMLSAALLLALAVPFLVASKVLGPDASPLVRTLVTAAVSARGPCAYVGYLAQDLLTLLLMMQSSSLAQATLNSYSAKRLLGLVQLGCSTGAVATGVLAGVLARSIGPPLMIVVQVLLLVASCIPNAYIWQVEERMVAGAEKRRAAAASRRKRAQGDGSDWWRSGLILSMALWTFSIIFCKTIVEYQYNVRLALDDGHSCMHARHARCSCCAISPSAMAIHLHACMYTGPTGRCHLALGDGRTHWVPVRGGWRALFCAERVRDGLIAAPRRHGGDSAHAPRSCLALVLILILALALALTLTSHLSPLTSHPSPSPR